MAQRAIIAFPIAGLVPGDPRLVTAVNSLSERQRKELDTLLKSPHAPQQAIQWVEKALANREPIAQVIDQLKQEEARILQARFATPAQQAAVRLLQNREETVTHAPRLEPLRVPRP